MKDSNITERLTDKDMDLIFREARTHSYWRDEPVSDSTLRELYDLLKWGPTSANTSPMRVLFLKTLEAKERLRPTLAPGNVEKTMAAPVTAIIAYDLHFYELLPKLSPARPALRDYFKSDPVLVESTAQRNSSMQGAYLIIAARAVGLDCGPMSGFDNLKVDEEFFGASNATDLDGQGFFTVGHTKSNFLCNLGYGDHQKLYPRMPRLDFDEACKIL